MNNDQVALRAGGIEPQRACAELTVGGIGGPIGTVTGAAGACAERADIVGRQAAVVGRGAGPFVERVMSDGPGTLRGAMLVSMALERFVVPVAARTVPLFNWFPATAEALMVPAAASKRMMPPSAVSIPACRRMTPWI